MIIKKLLPGVKIAKTISNTSRYLYRSVRYPDSPYSINVDGSVTFHYRTAGSPYSISAALSEYSRIAHPGESIQIYINNLTGSIGAAVTVPFTVDLSVPYLQALSKSGRVVKEQYTASINQIIDHVTKSKSPRSGREIFADWELITNDADSDEIFGVSTSDIADLSIFKADEKFGFLSSINNLETFSILQHPASADVMTIITAMRLDDQETIKRSTEIESYIGLNQNVWSQAAGAKPKTERRKRVHTIDEASGNQILSLMKDLWFVDVTFKFLTNSIEEAFSEYRRFERECLDAGILTYTHGLTTLQQLQSLYPGQSSMNEHLSLTVGDKVRKIMAGYTVTLSPTEA